MLHETVLVQHSVARLEQRCNHWKHCHNNVLTLCCAKNCLCELSGVTSPLKYYIKSNIRLKRCEINYNASVLDRTAKRKNGWSKVHRLTCNLARPFILCSPSSSALNMKAKKNTYYTILNHHRTKNCAPFVVSQRLFSDLFVRTAFRFLVLFVIISYSAIFIVWV